VLYDIAAGGAPTINVFGTVITMSGNVLYYSMWDLSSGVPVAQWSHLYATNVMSSYREFFETYFLSIFHLFANV